MPHFHRSRNMDMRGYIWMNKLDKENKKETKEVQGSNDSQRLNPWTFSLLFSFSLFKILDPNTAYVKDHRIKGTKGEISIIHFISLRLSICHFLPFRNSSANPRLKHRFPDQCTGQSRRRNFLYCFPLGYLEFPPSPFSQASRNLNQETLVRIRHSQKQKS